MPVHWTRLEISGLLQSSPFAMQDARGSFTKVFSGRLPGQEPLHIDEIFWSRSGRGVLRGLHVQVPPRAGRKLIFVAEGEVRDFILDLRVDSPWFGQVWETLLAPQNGALVIPAGCAHGFEALSKDATMIYAQEGTYDAATDTGVLWSSVGIEARNPHPIVSARDKALPAFQDFESPFTWSVE